MRINNHYKVQKRRSQVIENMEEFGCKNLTPLCPAIRSGDSHWRPNGAPGGLTWQDYQTGISKRNWESCSPWPHRTECLREAEQEKNLGSRQAGPSFLRGAKVFPWRSLQLRLPPSCPQHPASSFRHQGSQTTRAKTRGKWKQCLKQTLNVLESKELCKTNKFQKNQKKKECKW